jgi:hypothetical protein
LFTIYDVTGYEPAHSEAAAYVPNGLPFRNLGATASAKMEYGTLLPYLPVKSFAWRDAGTSPVNNDQPLSDTELKAGATPVFKLDRGFQLVSEMTRVNVYGQPVESRIPRTSGASNYSSSFYEGLGSWPVATFASGRADNCAILLAENGGLGSSDLDLATSTLDLPARNDVHRWRNSGAVFDASRSHTGTYSLKVTDASGAVIDLQLKDVGAEGFDYVVSAWVYAMPGSAPGMRLSRRQANGTSEGVTLDSYPGAPVEGGILYGKWQRWELKVTNAQLRAGGLFAGTGDFVRVNVGTSPGGGTVFVDDIVCSPAHAAFVYRTFDARGRVTSETDSYHQTRYFDLGYLGDVIAVRDEDFRILGQAGAHRLGENQP